MICLLLVPTSNSNLIFNIYNPKSDIGLPLGLIENHKLSTNEAKDQNSIQLWLSETVFASKQKIAKDNIKIFYIYSNSQN